MDHQTKTYISVPTIIGAANGAYYAYTAYMKAQEIGLFR